MMVEFSKTKRSKEDVGVQVLLQKLRMNDDEKQGVFLAKEGGKADNGERFQRDFTEEQDAICMVSNS